MFIQDTSNNQWKTDRRMPMPRLARGSARTTMHLDGGHVPALSPRTESSCDISQVVWRVYVGTLPLYISCHVPDSCCGSGVLLSAFPITKPWSQNFKSNVIVESILFESSTIPTSPPDALRQRLRTKFAGSVHTDLATTMVPRTPSGHDYLAIASIR